MRPTQTLSNWIGILCFVWVFPTFANETVTLVTRSVSEANKAYQAGKYQEASAAYQRAYEISQETGYLFNAAVCQWELSHFVEARALLKTYLLQAPKEDPLRKDANALLKRVEASLLEIEKIRKQTPAYTPVEVEVTVQPASLPAEMVFSSSKPERKFRTKLLTFGIVGSALIAGSITATVLLFQADDGIPNIGTIGER